MVKQLFRASFQSPIWILATSNPVDLVSLDYFCRKEFVFVFPLGYRMTIRSEVAIRVDSIRVCLILPTIIIRTIYEGRWESSYQH